MVVELMVVVLRLLNVLYNEEKLKKHQKKTKKNRKIKKERIKLFGFVLGKQQQGFSLSNAAECISILDVNSIYKRIRPSVGP